MLCSSSGGCPEYGAFLCPPWSQDAPGLLSVWQDTNSTTKVRSELARVDIPTRVDIPFRTRQRWHGIPISVRFAAETVQVTAFINKARIVAIVIRREPRSLVTLTH